MRYTSAVVLSTLAAGQVAATAVHNRHASFHERRHAEVKRGAADVDWSKVAYDLKDVDWEKVNWSSVFTGPTDTPDAAAAKPTPAAQAPKPANVPDVKSVAAYAAPTPQAAKPAQPSVQAASNPAGDYVTDFMYGVEAIASAMGIKTGKNDQSNNGGIWIGTDSPWQAEFTNGGSRDAVIYCWKANGFSGMILTDNTPDISVGLKPGNKVNLSFGENVPTACAPAFSGTTKSKFGGIYNTWWEATFGPTGAFDVSRNVNMKGDNIHSQGSKCTSDMSTCVFECTDSSASDCLAPYKLTNCGANNGGGGGYDPIMDGVGGGCSMGHSSEKVVVTIS